MRLKITRYNFEVEGLFSYRNSLGNLDDGTYNAINLYVGKDDRWKAWLVKVSWDEAIAGSAITLLRVLELHEPEASETSRLEIIAQFLTDCAVGKSPKLNRLTANMAIDVFDFLLLRGDLKGIAYLADTLVSRTSSPDGLYTIQAIMAPKAVPEAYAETCLYRELKASVERQGDFKAWFEEHIPKAQRPRAYRASGYDEAISTSSRRQRGKILELDLGM